MPCRGWILELTAVHVPQVINNYVLYPPKAKWTKFWRSLSLCFKNIVFTAMIIPWSPFPFFDHIGFYNTFATLNHTSHWGPSVLFKPTGFSSCRPCIICWCHMNGTFAREGYQVRLFLFASTTSIYCYTNYVACNSAWECVYYKRSWILHWTNLRVCRCASS